MRLALVNNYYDPHRLGGAEVSVQTLAESLVARGHEVSVLALAGDATPGLRTNNGVQVELVQRTLLGNGPHEKQRSAAGRLAWHLSAAADRGASAVIDRFLGDHAPDLVNTFNLAGFTTRSWRRISARGRPLVHTLFGTYLACFRGTMFRGGRDCRSQCTSCRLLTRVRRRDSSLPDAVVGDSRAVLQRHLDAGYFDAVPIKRVINCGFDAPEVPVAPARSEDAPLTIGFMGRLHPTKGVHVLLDALERLPAGAVWRARIAGGGDDQAERAVRARCTGQIEFAGWTRPEQFLAQLDVLVVPSMWNDPLPRGVFEALSYGVPVIGSAIGGIPEMVTEDREGHLFPPGDADALAHVLRSAIERPDRLRAKRAACLAAAGHYTAERMTDDYEALYGELLGVGDTAAIGDREPA